MTLLAVSHVTKCFQRKNVLSDVSFSVSEGEFLTLLGPSGCGKTTLLRIISGLEKPTSGSIFLNNLDITHTSPQSRSIRTVFQHYALFPHLNVYDNIAFGLRCTGHDKNTVIKRVNDMLERLSLQSLKHRKPRYLSGGEQQRVAIARAMVNQPVILLLDESLSALDSLLRQQLRLELKLLQKELGIAFVFVTHDPEEALSLSDRMVILQNGCVMHVGTPVESYENPNSLFVAKFVGDVNLFKVYITDVNKTHMKGMLMSHVWHGTQSSPHTCIGQWVNVLLRPEDIQLLDVNSADYRLEGIVSAIVYKGATVDWHICVNQQMVHVTSFCDADTSVQKWPEGSVVRLTWPSKWETVLHQNCL
jgi:spermidine/putrescine transport system ATP-binding protein